MASSPFPGMDPYLEAPSLWPGVHLRLIGTIGELLAQGLRPRYFVDVERRVYVLDEDDPARRLFVPDVTILAGPRPATSGSREPEAHGARPKRGPTPTTLIMATEPLSVSEARIVIRAVAGDRPVVTVVEVLSPTNKVEGSRGRAEYLAKRRELMRSSVHLVEIDLLRGGSRFPSVQPLPAADYYVHVSRAELRPRGDVFAWRLRDELPDALPIPLGGGDADASLDLGRAVRETYERNGYDLAIDYGGPAEPPVAGDDGAWADAILRRAGLR